MKVRVAEVRGFSEEICLEYYVTGGREEGYGITIVLIENETITKKECRKVTTCFSYAARFAKALASGAVFPVHLEEIIQDTVGIPSFLEGAG